MRNLPTNVEQEIVSLAKKCGVEQVILFGSRARGDHRERSDVNLAIRGGNSVDFITIVDEDIPTLLMFDIVDLNKPVPSELLEAINFEGVTIYEKV